MVFNIKKFLVENRLTKRAFLKEDYRDRKDNLTIIQRCIELGDKNPEEWGDLKAAAIEVYEDYKEHKDKSSLDSDVESLLDSHEPPSSVIPYETPDEDSRGSFRGMREDDNTGLVMSTGDEEETFDDEEETDDWNAPEADDSAEFEKEPSAKDVKQNDKSLTGIHKKQADLQALEDKKDALLMQLKSNIISLDQYKQEIGNIPMQIKKLRADLDKAMNVSVDDDSEMDSEEAALRADPQTWL